MKLRRKLLTLEASRRVKNNQQNHEPLLVTSSGFQ